VIEGGNGLKGIQRMQTFLASKEGLRGEGWKREGMGREKQSSIPDSVQNK